MLSTGVTDQAPNFPDHVPGQPQAILAEIMTG